MTTMLRTLLALCFGVALGFGAAPAFAVGGDSTPTAAPKPPADPNVTAAKQAIDAKDWGKALELLKKADAKDADVQNWLGYTYRNMGNFDLAFKHYEEAIRINPKHRGAHEYIGEAYLLTNNLKKAEEHLAALDKLCFFPCEEYNELKEKVTAYKKKTASGG